MDKEDQVELFDIVRDAVDTYGRELTIRAISDSHMGRLDGRVVTPDNLHLFRRYRNTVTPSGVALMKEATR